METYIVKMNGEKVRAFNNPVVAHAWATKHCRGKIEIVQLKERKKLPKAGDRHMYPNLDFYTPLVYRPFESLT